MKNSIVWSELVTNKGFEFLVYRTKGGKGDVILLKELNTEKMSLTNSIEGVIEYCVYGDANYKDLKFYQWGDDGLFEVIPIWGPKLTRDMPPMKVKDVKWRFISKDLTAFQVLYCD